MLGPDVACPKAIRYSFRLTGDWDRDAALFLQSILIVGYAGQVITVHDKTRMAEMMFPHYTLKLEIKSARLNDGYV